MSRIAIPHITVTVAGHVESSYTSFGATSDRVLGLSTALPDHAFELVSCYLQEPGGAIGASHLQLCPRSPADGVYRIMPADGVAAVNASWCLLDHVAHLRDRLAEHCDATVVIDVADAALDRAPAWTA